MSSSSASGAVDVPETRYTTVDGAHIAYQVVGDGPMDLVFVPGLVSHLDTLWAEPAPRAFFSSLASFSRLILFDKRGSGLSDRGVGEPTVERVADDCLAVMDAAGSDSAAVVGYSEGGPTSIFLAASNPDRVDSLVLLETRARFAPGPGYPCNEEAERAKEMIFRAVDEWGSGWSANIWLPDRADDPRIRESIARWERLAATPGAVRQLVEVVSDIDVRDLLPTVRVPTLVVQRPDSFNGRCAGRLLAENIPDARLVEQDGDEHLVWLGASEELVKTVREFLTGTSSKPDPTRELATVMFTDIVASTERAAELGDRRWGAMLDDHDRIVREELDRFGGREVKTTGDGFVATFDGPARAIRCADTIRNRVAREIDLEIRAGIHTGEIELRGDGDIAGIGVHLSARIQAAAAAGEVFVSRTVVDLVAGSKIEFADRGSHDLKGVPRDWRLYAVRDPGL